MIRLHWLCASLSETTEGLAFLTATVRRETGILHPADGSGQGGPRHHWHGGEGLLMKQTRRAASQLFGALPPK